MLKGIVENQHLPRIDSKCGNRGGKAIGILQVWEARKFGGKLECFVIRFATARTITSADDCDFNPEIQKPAGQPSDKGRFACASNGQVANADHRCRDALSSQRSAIKPGISASHDPSIGRLKASEGAARNPSDQSAPASAHQVAEL